MAEVYLGDLATTEFPSGITTDVELAAGLATKAALVHTHDDRYYTEAETDLLLADKVDEDSLGTAALLNVGTSAENIVQLDESGKLPAVDGSQLTGVGGAVDSVFGRTGTVSAAASDYDASQIDNDSTVTGLTVKAALETLDGDKADTSSLSTVATSGSYSDLSSKPTLGTASALNVGTSALNVVQLNADAKLPAVDGSLLTNISGGDVSSVFGRTGAVTASASDYDASQVDNDSSVTGLTVKAALDQLDSDKADASSLATVATSGSYSDLSSKPTLGTAAALNVGTSALNILQLNGDAKIPAVDGSLITNLPASGETNTASNLGAGTGIYAQKSSVDLQFKSLVEGTGISLSADTTEITISASGGLSVWNTISASKYTATPADTDTLTMSDTSDMVVGLPLKYTYGGTAYYGIVKSITTDTSIDICGAPLVVESDLTALSVGTANMVQQVDFFVSGQFANSADDDLLLTDMRSSFDWNQTAAYLVQIRAKCYAADTGSNDPRINVSIGGDTNYVSTANSNAGIAVTDSWSETGIDISTTHYSIARDEKIEISTDANGSSDDAEDLTVSCVFVLI